MNKFALMCSALLLSTHALATKPNDTAAWYVEMYGAAERVGNIERAHTIFRDVKRSSKGVPADTKLLVIKSKSKPWAIALPDGNIIISNKTVDLVYNNVDQEIGDARMAFILGHEIAHQLNDDFWHQTLSGPSDAIGNLNDTKIRHIKEIKADADGFTNAMLAGYRTDKLIDQIGNQSFLEFWVANTGTISPKTHPSAKDRSNLLRSRLQNVQDKAETFKYGVRLAHFGRNKDALEFLNYFHDEYRSREVVNNLGYVYLQIARSKMPSEIAYRFWYRTLLEPDSGLKNRSWLTTDVARDDLELAQEYLESAVKLDRTDVVSRINLIAVYLYLDKTGAARDLIKEIGKLQPGNPMALGLRALILYQEEPSIDTWERAKLLLEPLVATEDAPYDLIYNYSRLLQERGRDGAARVHWEKLAENINKIPTAYQKIICLEVKTQSCESSPVNIDIEYGETQTKLLKLGDDVDSPESRALLKHWDIKKELRVGSVNARLFSNNGDTMLAIDDKIELASLKNHKFSSSDHLIAMKGEPLVQYPMASGEIWSYGNQWSALVKDGLVQEIWLTRP